MCHEIAHAYRRHHGIESVTRQIDEEQTDLTTIYLGFGVLTVNNAHRFRKSGDAHTTRWSTTQTGYLSLQAMAYVFAAQCVARGTAAAEVTRLGRLLEANQRECFEAARRELGVDVDGLRARLGIPPVETWPPETPFELPELRDDARFEPIDADTVRRDEHARRNQGRGVWRIASTSGGRLGAAGVVAASVIAGLVAARLEVSVSGAIVAGAAFGAVGGAWLGRRFVRYSCSDLGCGAALAPDVTDRCSKCGGSLLGTLDDERDRLEAEDALAAHRPVEDLRRELAARRAKRARRVLMVVAIVGLVATGLAVLDALPRAATIAAVERGDDELRRAKVVVTGYVVDSRVGTMSLVDEKGTPLVPFRLSDDSGRMLVWYEPTTLAPPMREGDHVRATGQSFLVDTDDEKKVRFIASGVKRVP
jgi:hypothetical protein